MSIYDKPTWEMTAEELAAVVANGTDHKTDAETVKRMLDAEWILPGRGVNWVKISADEDKLPEPVKPKRKATRIFHGVRFVHQDDGSWLTEDGQFVVALEDGFMTDCEDEHPVRITQDMKDRFNADLARIGDNATMSRWGITPYLAIKQGKKGFMCPGGEDHTYSLWVAGAVKGEPEVVNREETFTASAKHLAQFINGDAEIFA